MEKYTLNDKHRELLRKMRNFRGLSAEEVSEKINHHKSWLGQIERGRLASIKKDDLDKLLSILLDNPLSSIIEFNSSDSFYTSIFETPEIDNNIMHKISNTINEILPVQYNSTSTFIKSRMKKITNIFCNEQNNTHSQFIHTMMGLNQHLANVTENSNYALLFLNFPLDAIFKKYKDNPEIILEIYDHIKYYLDSKLSDNEK